MSFWYILKGAGQIKTGQNGKIEVTWSVCVLYCKFRKQL